MIIITLSNYKKLQVKWFWLTWRVLASAEEVLGMGCHQWLIHLEQVHSGLLVPLHFTARSRGMQLIKGMPIWNRNCTNQERALTCFGISQECLLLVKLHWLNGIWKPFTTQCTSVLISYLSFSKIRFSWATVATFGSSTFTANMFIIVNSADFL